MNNNKLYIIENFIEIQEMKWIDNMLNLVVDKIYNWDIEKNNEFKSLKRKIWAAYEIMKDQFSETFRDDWERYFEHLREVTNLVLEFIPNPNSEKVLIALLHDSIEDTDIDYHVVKVLFWSKIAIAVEWLSKKDSNLYLDENEKNEFNELKRNNELSSDRYLELKNIWKERRNSDYFSHLESFESMKQYVIQLVNNDNLNLSDTETEEITINIIDVKLADRIHNLSTQWDENNIDKVRRKIDETKKYFLNIAEEVNIKAYNRIKSLLLILELKLENFSWRVDIIIEK